jgi:ankyrin repeat protein
MGMTPLFEALVNSDIAMVRLLLDRGADVRTASNGVPPLHQAIDYGGPELVGLLLERGADVNGTDSDGQSPLPFAVGRAGSASGAKMQEIEKTIRLLVAAGADLTARDKVGLTPLEAAKRDRSHGVVDILRAAGRTAPSAKSSFWRKLFSPP